MTDLNAFYRDDRTGEYSVRIDVCATAYQVITADSPEDAKAKVEAMLANHEVELYGSDFTSADIAYCRKTPPMFCIRRPGDADITATSQPRPGDEPREPNQYELNAYKPVVLK